MLSRSSVRYALGLNGQSRALSMARRPKMAIRFASSTSFRGYSGSSYSGLSSAPHNNNVPPSYGINNLPPHNNSHISLDSDMPRCSLIVEVKDEPGALYYLLSYFWKYDIQLTSIESKPVLGDDKTMTIHLSFAGSRGDSVIDRLFYDLKSMAMCKDLLILDSKIVPWFPRHISDLDAISNRVIDGGEGGELQADHPGFTDKEYKKRRMELADIAMSYKFGERIPYIEYKDYEKQTWGVVYNELKKLRPMACREYRDIIERMESEIGYSAEEIPQAQDISDFLGRRSGFRLRPVAGLLSSRDFFAGLAYRTFFSTQYIRHQSKPLYTPEPDICHELLGHAPMFADPDFADFSQEFGLASLGASDEDIKRLAHCYWYTVEFGLLKERGDLKAYGAGLLSSFGEMNHAINNKDGDDAPRHLPWDPAVASVTSYPITTYQPTYFVAESFSDAKHKLREFSGTLPKPFYARYNPMTQSVWVDRALTLDKVDKNAI
jgi:phenylalanine-4-hydroxylase